MKTSSILEVKHHGDMFKMRAIIALIISCSLIGADGSPSIYVLHDKIQQYSNLSLIIQDSTRINEKIVQVYLSNKKIELLASMTTMSDKKSCWINLLIDYQLGEFYFNKTGNYRVKVIYGDIISDIPFSVLPNSDSAVVQDRMSKYIDDKKVARKLTIGDTIESDVVGTLSRELPGSSLLQIIYVNNLSCAVKSKTQIIASNLQEYLVKKEGIRSLYSMNEACKVSDTSNIYDAEMSYLQCICLANGNKSDALLAISILETVINSKITFWHEKCLKLLKEIKDNEKNYK